ncbi:MAG: hypothetical protein K2I80_06535 [Ruminococcus sp.]|nr:hypothetical protein [Ruminococcus sp.]MDE6847782.1 hypothetical protein [Ruminococcus sp.]
MGIYREKKEQLIEKIEFYKKRIADDTAKKKAAEDKLKEVSRLAMAEEYNCKPRELDEIISAEHQLLQKLRSGGMTDAELLELVGGKNAEGYISSDKNNDDSMNSDSHYADDEDDGISFYDNSDGGED